MAEPTPTSSSSSAFPQTVVLKKYGNRRLYDTHASKYVTLHEVEEMVQRGTDVQIVDAKSGDDLTKEILVQIILDKDGAREMLPTSFLKQVVQLSASPLKEKFSRSVQDALDGFLSGQRALMDAQRSMLSQVQQIPATWNPFALGSGLGSALGPTLGANPFAPPPPPPQSWQQAAQQQQQAQQQAQQQQQQQAQHAQQQGPSPQASFGEVERLRAEVSETQALLRQLIAQQQPPSPRKRKAR